MCCCYVCHLILKGRIYIYLLRHTQRGHASDTVHSMQGPGDATTRDIIALRNEAASTFKSNNVLAASDFTTVPIDLQGASAAMPRSNKGSVKKGGEVRRVAVVP